LGSHRTHRPRLTAAVAGAAVVATLTAGLGAPGVAAAGAADAAPALAGGSHLVTLVTGDRVAVSDAGEVTGLVRAEGRENVPVQVLRTAEETLVLPSDVLPLLADGRLDRRLFDVAELSRDAYREAGGLRLIVTYEGDRAPAPLRQAAAAGDERTPLPAIDAEALTVPPEQAGDVWSALTAPGGQARTLTASPGIESIALDGLVAASLAESVPQIGAPAAWEAGFDGAGVTVAVLDTGISSTHPDVAGQVADARNFSDAADAEDREGHGTHVASTVAGTGAMSGGAYTGVAPGARLLNGKVLDDSGNGWESDAIEGMQWAVDQGADIVSISLGGWAGDEIDPMEEAVNALSAASDTLFVIAAGNDGPSPGTIGSPGTADAALTVGAVDRQDAVADFSSVGPRTRDGAVKPDITAPGVDIVAAGAEGAAIWEYGTPVTDGYVAISGTSMATPHVAGAAALLAQAHPEWDGERLKSALTASARPSEGYTPLQQGVGRVDVPAALERTVVADTASLNFGTVAYPHDTAEPITRELTYRNLGSADVTLDLSAAGFAPDGTAAPDGMFTVGADRVTVPAGGTATVEVTASTRPGGDVHGTYSAYVTATAQDGQSLRTSGSVVREEQLFDLTVEATDRHGEPADTWSTSVFHLERGEFLDLHQEEGTATATGRVPAGTYLVSTEFREIPESGEVPVGLDWITDPAVAVAGPTTVRADATRAEPVEMTVEDSRATLSGLALGMSLGRVEDEGQSFHTTWLLGDLPEDVRTAQLGDAPEGWRLTGDAAAIWEHGDDRQYHLADASEDSFYTGLDLHVPLRDMARIDIAQSAWAPDREGLLLTFSSLSEVSSTRSLSLPRTTEVFVQAAAGRWTHEFWQTDPEGLDESGHAARERTYRAGQRYREAFNNAVFGPALPGERSGIFRSGNLLYGGTTPFADGAGHDGYSMVGSGGATLYRDGEEYASSDYGPELFEFAVPADEAEYRLVITGSRPEATVGTEVTAAYTFTSGPVGEEETVRLPATAVRFTPRLAPDGTAPAGQRFAVPVTLQGSAAGDGRASLTVEVSLDRGETWRRAPVTDGRIQVTNPAAGGTVSLRATATDRAGGSVTQTLIDAYRTA
jgi:subtilisin family serine protease